MASSQQVTGLASGLDTASIVSKLMSIERQPLIRLQQQASVEQARQTALSTIRSKLDALSSALADLKSVTAWSDTQTVDSSNASAVAAVRTGGAAAGGYRIWVSQLARADQISTQTLPGFTAGADDRLTIAVGASSVNVDVKAGDNLTTIASRINSSSNVPVYATVVSDRIVLSGKTTGEAATIAVSSTGTLRDTLFGVAPLTHTNQSALVSLTGANDPAPLKRASNTIDDLIPGIKLTLKATSTGADPTATIVVGEPAPDTAAVQKKLQTFVDAYNSARDFISAKLKEQRVANPTTDADRAKGILAGDPGLSGLLAQLREAVSAPLATAPAAMQLLSQAGISTGKSTGSGTLNADSVAGRLTVDSATLSTALQGNLAGVKNLVTGAGGLLDRLTPLVDPWLKGNGAVGSILDSRLESSRNTVKANEREQASLNVRLDARQKRLEAQFAALETALSQSQSQSSWLGGQIAALRA